MKKFLTIMVLLLLCTNTFAALTYGPTYYRNNFQYQENSTRNPIYLFLDEMDTLTSGGLIYQFTPTTEPATPAEGMSYYDDVAKAVKLYTGAAFVALGTTANGTSLDGSYDLGSGITVDGDAVTLTVTDNANNAALSIAQNDATNDPDGLLITMATDSDGIALHINGVTASTDISADNWSVSTAGVFTYANAETIDNATDDKFEFNSNDKEDFTLDLSGTNIVGFASDTDAVTLEFNALDAFTGVGSITFDAAAATITTATSGDAQDLTVSVTGAHDSSLILTSAGTSTTDATQLLATVGSIKINSADNLDIDAADNITIDTAGGALTTTVTGGDYTVDITDKSYKLDSGEADADAIWLCATDAAGGINIDCGTGTLDIDVAGAINMTNSTAVDITIDSTAGSVNITGTQEAADAIAILADGTAGGITVGFGTGNMVVTGTGASADFTLDADLISIDGTGTSNITCTNGAGEDFTISTAGAADHSLIITTTGTAADSLQITTTAGGMDITNGGASGEDLDIDGVLSAVTINSDEATTDAIDISATLGGITMTSTAVASSWTHTSTGTADDLTISVAGATNSSLILASSGTGEDALSLLASGTSASAASILIDTADGGIVMTADGSIKGDITIDAADDITITAVGKVTMNLGAEASTYQGNFLPATVKKQTITTSSLSTAHCGYCNQVAVDAQTITLPAAVAGVEFWIMCTAADGVALVTIELDNSDKFIGAGLTPADGEAILLTQATQNYGDYIKVSAHTDGWIITEMVGTWAEASP